MNILRPLDRLQQRVPALAYPVAVVIKSVEDGAGRLAALIAYYAFISLFPLSLIFVTVLGFLLPGNPRLQDDVVHGAVAHIPIIGDQLRLHGLHGQWWVLIASLLVMLWGGRGVAVALQHALNTIWNVPISERPSILSEFTRSLGLLGTLGVSSILTGFLSGVGGWTGSATLRVAAFVVSAAVSVGAFVLAFRLALAWHIRTRQVIRGAIVAALFWQGMLATGHLLIAHVVNHAQSLYGAFGLVIGLLGWLHVLAVLTLIAAEGDVVRARKLWPRAFIVPPLTGADREALTAYALVQRRLPPDEQQVKVSFAGTDASSANGSARANGSEPSLTPPGGAASPPS